MANTVSENIRKLRQKKGISQDRLSKDADLALNTVVKIETGENPNPTVDTLEKIAKALGVPVAELMNHPAPRAQGIQRKFYNQKPMVSDTFLAWRPCGKTAGNSKFKK